MTHTLQLRGSCPCKKNAWRRKTGQQNYLPAGMEAELDSLQFQAQSQWKRPALAKVRAIRATFYVRDGRSDLDGKYTTLQDVLVKAGVLANDSIKRIPRFSCEAVVYAGEEQVRVELEVL